MSEYDDNRNILNINYKVKVPSKATVAKFERTLSYRSLECYSLNRGCLKLIKTYDLEKSNNLHVETKGRGRVMINIFCSSSVQDLID